MEIRIFAKQVKGTTEKGKKYDFLKYSYTKDGKTFLDVKFTKDCDIKIPEQGYYLLEVDLTDMNIKKSKPVKTQDGGTYKANDTLWITKVNACMRNVEYERELEERRLSELKELF